MNVTTSLDIMKKMVRRGDEITLPDEIDGLYNQLLFDLCSDDSLLAFTLFGTYNPALDVIGFTNDTVRERSVNFLTYVAASGAAAGSPTSGVHVDPCEPGLGVESGFCNYTLKGWGRIRRSTEARDITDVIQKMCENQPMYTIAGRRIADDYTWDLTRLSAVMLQDMQRQLIIGNKSNPGEHDGLSRIVKFGYATELGQECTMMDSTVIDYNGNDMCPSDITNVTGVTINGVAVTGNYQLLDYINSWLRRNAKRISMSSLSGQYTQIGLIPTETLNCLIDCWVCYTTCGRDVTRMLEPEVRTEIARIKSDLINNRAVRLNHQGIDVIWYPWDYELVDGEGDSDIYILTPSVGTTPLLRVMMKEMTPAANHESQTGSQDMRVTDNGRFLSWKTNDNTCYRVHTEFQWRWWLVAPWAQLRITGVACTSLFGQISEDPLSEYYPEKNLVASQKAPSTPPNAAFTFVVAGLQSTFTNTTTITNAKQPISYLWIFGDGTTSTAVNPVKTYGAAGTYSVTLVVTNPDGQDTFTDDVTVA